MTSGPGGSLPASVSADYLIAGLVVRSAIPLPLAPAHAGDADVTVNEGRVPPLAGLDDERVRPVVEGAENHMRLWWSGVARMSVDDGRAIVVDREPAVDIARVSPLVLGVGLGLILHQRGRLVLHASAVSLPQGAVAFVGWKGAGKSTAAGAMLRRGHAIITDDSLPLDAESEGVPVAWPGPAPLKLWPESATALGRAPRRLQRLHPTISKRVLSDVPQATGPLPLRAIYSLSVGSELAVQQVRGQEALVEIMRHG